MRKNSIHMLFVSFQRNFLNILGLHIFKQTVICLKLVTFPQSSVTSFSLYLSKLSFYTNSLTAEELSWLPQPSQNPCFKLLRLYDLTLNQVTRYCSLLFYNVWNSILIHCMPYRWKSVPSIKYISYFSNYFSIFLEDKSNAFPFFHCFGVRLSG